MLARKSLFSAFAVLLLASPGLSQSISIPIPNYDFASPYVPDFSPYTVAGVSNWVQSPPPAWWTADGYTTQQWDDNVGVFINVPSEWIDNLVPSGGTAVHQQAAFMFSAPGLELSQTLSTSYQVGTSYQLTVGIEGGGQGMPLGVPMQIELYYLDGSGNQVPVGTTTVLNDLTLNPYLGQYITDLPDRQLTIPAVAAGDPWAGQNIGVALLQIASTANTGYWDIDNVRLTATTASITASTTASTAVWTGAAGNTNWSSSGNWGGARAGVGGFAHVCEFRERPKHERLPGGHLLCRHHFCGRRSAFQPAGQRDPTFGPRRQSEQRQPDDRPGPASRCGRWHARFGFRQHDDHRGNQRIGAHESR